MKPKKEYLATTQVPNDVLAALSKRHLLNHETRLIIALCSLADKVPGQCWANVSAVAKQLGEGLDKTNELLRTAILNGLVKLQRPKPNDIAQRAVYIVQAPSLWNVLQG